MKTSTTRRHSTPEQEQPRRGGFAIPRIAPKIIRVMKKGPGTVVTVMNMKGGVGKTTLAMHLGGVLSRYIISSRVRHVLLIDYDPQFNLSQSFLVPKTYFALEKERKTSLSILQDNEVDLNPYVLQVPGNHEPPDPAELAQTIYQTKTGRLALIPSTLDLMFVALGQSEKRSRPFEERFEKFVEKCRREYDLVLIDCHPAGSILTKTSLQSSDHVVIPVTPHRYALRGIGLMLEFINARKASNTPIVPHILFNCVPRRGEWSDEKVIRTNVDFQPLCFLNTMKNYRVFSEPLAGAGFCWFSNKAYSTMALHNIIDIAREFVSRTGLS